MLRLRRYRVFLFVAALILFGLYYLTDARSWRGRSPAFLQNVHSSSSSNDVEKSRGAKTPNDSMFKNSKSESQIAIPGAEGKRKGKGSSKGFGDVFEFPHKKPSEEPAIDERLPKGKHDPPSTSTTTGKVSHFTKMSENFPVPDDFVIKLPDGKPKAIPRIQHAFARETTHEKKDRQKKLKKLKKTFLRHWAGYKEYAWDHDELRPVSGSFQDPFAGWRATLVDSLDMLWIMGLKEEFEEAVDEVSHIDFTTTNREMLPLFEVAIRYMGGLIAAYDISESRYPVLLDKAKQLGDVLMGAFDTPNRMPATFYHWHTENRQRMAVGSSSTVLAEIGSLSMEFIRLAQITEDHRYYDAVARITDEFEIWQNMTKVPGLWPLSVDASGGCTLGDLERDKKEKEGIIISNEGTSNAYKPEEDSERKLKDTVKNKLPAEVQSALKEHEKLSKGRNPVETKQGKPSKASSPKASIQEEHVMDADEDEEVEVLDSSDRSLRKRAPPKYKAKDDVSDTRSSAQTAHDAGDEKEDMDRASSVSTKSRKPLAQVDSEDEEEDVNEDDDTQLVHQPKRPSAKGNADPRFTSTDSTGRTGKSSFADDEVAAPERPSSKNSKTAKAGKSKSKTTSLDDDEEQDPINSDRTSQAISPAKKLAGDSSYHDNTGVKDKSSFGSDSKHGARNKPSKTQRPIDMKSKDSSSFGDASDDERPAFKHNKAMHRCVTRGLQSTYGDTGSDKYSLGGMADSVYEYLPKSYLLLGGLEPQYQRMHEMAMKGVKDYLLFRTMTNDTKRPVFFTGDFQTQGFLDNETDRVRGSFTPHTGHLTCFQGAFIALAARAFRNEGDIDLARKLTDGCIWAYEQTPTGIMPELIDMVPCVNLTGPCKFNETRWWDAIDPWASDRVAVFQSMAADTDRDTISAAKGGSKDTKKANKRDVDPSLANANSIWNSRIGRDSQTVEAPSELDHLPDKRRPDSNVRPAPTTASTEAIGQPTTIPEYMDRTIKWKKLTPGVTRMLNPEYILRPEAIESVFYLYRITGDPYFREKGWQMFEAIDNATAAEHGNSAIWDVLAEPEDVKLKDRAESFWTAETLKYFWLLFSEPDVVSLDDWVFNTEAHPFRRPDLDVRREKAAERTRRRKGLGGDMVWDLD